MRKLAGILGTLAVVGALTSAAAVSAGAEPAGAQEPEGYSWEWVDVIVVLDDDENAGLLSQRTASVTGGTVGQTYHYAINGFNITLPEAWLPIVEAIPGVAYIERNRMVQVAAQTTPVGVLRVGGGDVLPLDGGGREVDVDVAIIDTGIDLDHPDLNVVDGVTCVQDLNGVTCTEGAGDDDHGHGTHVAGTIGALDNGEGIVGVAPGARLHAVKTLNSSGAGSTATIIAGLDWVAARADTIEVVNMSFGGAGFSQSEYQAVQRAVDLGISFAVAAGNSREPASTISPAAFDNVLTVSALADFDGIPGGAGTATCRGFLDDWLAGFSNYGPAVDIAAPGACILSTLPVQDGSYGLKSGTSMASPHVAGALGLLASVDKPTNAAEVEALYDELRNSGTYDWFGDFDGDQEPLLNVSSIEPVFVGDSPVAPEPPLPPVLPPGTYSYYTGIGDFYWGMNITYYNYWGGSTSGIWSNTMPGECTIPVGEIKCDFGQFAFFWMPDLTWTGDDGTVLTGTP